MHRRHTASGQILPAVALFLTALLGVCALAIDGSNMYSQRRRLQADLDVAIKVAAARMYNTSLASSVYTYTVAQAAYNFSSKHTVIYYCQFHPAMIAELTIVP